jgi:outer membrane biogenesis lipoprotein LolB
MRILLIGFAALALTGCGPMPQSNQTIVEETTYCAQSHMDTIMEKTFGGFYVVCVPPKMSMLEQLEFYQWKESQKNVKPKQVKEFKPENPLSFETQSKTTQ